MKQKLLFKTQKSYLILSIIVFLISAPLFYIVTNKLNVHEADETLLLRKKVFVKHTLPTFKIREIAYFNKFNQDIKIEKNNINQIQDSLFYKYFGEELNHEKEESRVLSAPIIIENQTFNFITKINLVENEDLIQSIALLFIVLLILMLLGLYFVTKWLANKLWEPFYNTLKQIETFEIDKMGSPNFVQTNVEEFGRLNGSIHKLIENNLIIYNSQREFVENAAHELQTPLAVFQANIELLIQRDDITSGQADILTKLSESVSKLNRLNKNLLLLSKIDNQHFVPTETISINELLNKNFDFFGEQASLKNIRITKFEDKSVFVKTNATLLDILINNLFMNAIRHNIQNGTIEIKVFENAITFSNTGSLKALSEDKLFQRFSKVNPTAQGNGLGLAIIKKIADLNHWQVKYNFIGDLHVFSIQF